MPIQPLLDEYAESHKNATNKLIHWICVPVITFTVVGLFWAIPCPVFLDNWGLNWGILFLLSAMVYYFSLSTTIAIGMALFTSLLGGIWWYMEKAGCSKQDIVILSLLLFIIAWIGQFVGHKIEGKKPSFLKDVQFLLIGPAWLLSFIYKKLNITYQ